MTYLSRIQATPAQKPHVNKSNSNGSAVMPFAQIRRRPTTDGTSIDINKPNNQSSQLSASESQKRTNLDQGKAQPLTTIGSAWRKTYYKPSWVTPTPYTYRSGDHSSKTSRQTAGPIHLFLPGVGDTAEANYIRLPKRQYLDDHCTRVIRNQTPAPPASHMIRQRRPIQVQDRRDISRAEADRLQAARLACLLATEAAVESARQRVLERREAKLLELRSRMQLRHQQAEARRKALEQAEKERFIRLSQRQHRATIAHPPSGQYRVQSARPGFQSRSLRLPIRPHTAISSACTQLDRRPVVAFGSTTPRIACMTSRQLQALYQMNNNSCDVVKQTSMDHPSDTSSCNLSTWDSRRSYKRQNAYVVHTRDKYASIEDQSLIRSSQSAQVGKPKESNSNAVRSGVSVSRANRMATSATTLQKQVPINSASAPSNTAKRVPVTRAADRHIGKDGFRNCYLKNATTTKSKILDVYRQSKAGKHSAAKSEHTRKSKSPVIKAQKSGTRTNRASPGLVSKGKSAQFDISKELSKLAIRCVDNRIAANRRLQQKSHSEKTTEEEAYRVKMQQQRRKAKEQLGLGNALTTNHGEVMGPSILIERPTVKQLTSEDTEDVAKLPEHEVSPHTIQYAGDLVFEDVEPREHNAPRQTPVHEFKDPLVTSSTLQPASPGHEVGIPPSESTLWTDIDASLNPGEAGLLHQKTAALRANLFKRSLNFGPNSSITLSKREESAEREARRRRLEDIMARLKPVNRSGSPVARASTPAPAAPPLTNDTNIVPQVTAEPLDPASSVDTQDQSHLPSRPQSSTSGYLTDPVFSNESVVWPVTNDATKWESRTDAAQVTKLEVDRNVAAAPLLSPANSPHPKRANVVANLLASGRLNVRSRAATILLNMASGRPPTDGLGPQNHSNITEVGESFRQATPTRREIVPDMSEVMPH